MHKSPVPNAVKLGQKTGRGGRQRAGAGGSHVHTAAARSGLHASGKKAIRPIGMEAHLRRTRCRSGGCGSFPLRGLWAGRTASPR